MSESPTDTLADVSPDDLDISSVKDGKVLIVDDEEHLVDLHVHRISRRYDAIPAYGGEEALEKIDHSVDVVLLDRRMPDIDGDEVAKTICSEGYDCQIVLVTAIDPDDSILDLPLDEYITKPVGKNELSDEVEHQLRIQKLNTTTTEIEAVKNKIEAFENEYHPAELRDRESYQTLVSQKDLLAEIRDELRSAIGAE